MVDLDAVCCYNNPAEKKRAFFYVCKKLLQASLYDYGRWITVRTKITLECTECKQRNYDTMKEKRLHPDRMETKKYCKFCRKHTLHKETK